MPAIIATQLILRNMGTVCRKPTERALMSLERWERSLRGFLKHFQMGFVIFRYPYVLKVEKKVKELLDAHRAKVFDLWLEQGKIVCHPNYALKPTISPTIATSVIPKSLYTSEEDMNDYERKMAWALSSMPNIKWWHRNISRQGFMINGSTRAYPDLIAMTTVGKILMIETKGDHLDKLGAQAGICTTTNHPICQIYNTPNFFANFVGDSLGDSLF